MSTGAIKRHYEKVIAACCFLILFTNVGLPSTSFSVFQPYLVDLPGVGNTGGSIIISVRTFMSLIGMLVVGRYYDLLNCRVGAFLASLCVCAGFFLYSQNTGSFIGLCAGSVFTGLGYGLGGMIASTMLINRWFRSNVATVAGIAAVGSGVAAVILPNVAVALIGTYSLSVAFLFESALALVLGVLVFLLLRNYPRDLGLKPYEAPEGKKAGKPGRARAARRNRNVPEKLAPLVLVAMTFVGCISVGGTSYLAVLFTSEGFSAEGAAALVALCGGCLTVAKLASGVVFDRVGTKRGSMFFFALFIGGTLLLCLSDMGNVACGRWRVPLRSGALARYRGHICLVDRARAARSRGQDDQELPALLCARRVHLHVPPRLFGRSVRNLSCYVRDFARDDRVRRRGRRECVPFGRPSGF